MDLVYYLVGSLTPEDRQAHFTQLLVLYLDGLAAYGGPIVGMDEALCLYQRYLAYGLFIWSVARELIVPIPVLKRLLHRFAIAAEEANTFGRLVV